MIATMRRVGSPLMALAVTLMMANAAEAQQRQGGGRGAGMGGFGIQREVSLAGNPAVQKELGLNEEQAKEAEALATEFREELQKEFPANFRELPQAERAEAMRELQAKTHKLADGYAPKLAKVLKPEQVKRLEEITVQAAGLGAFHFPAVQKALHLKDEQKKELTAIAEGVTAKIRESAGEGAERVAAMQKIRKEAEEEATKILTEEQKKTFEELKGKPFDTAALRPNFGGQGGRRGGNN